LRLAPAEFHAQSGKGGISFNRIVMGINYWVGKTFASLRDAALVRRAPVLWSRYPRGHVLELDLARWTQKRPLKVIVDVGANVGQTALEFSRWFPTSAIHSFEPVKANFDLLRMRTVHSKQISAHHAACGAQSGTQMIRYGVHSHLHSLAAQGTTIAPDAGESVSVTTVDEFSAQHSIASIDLLKTDTEGYDLEVLRGAEAMLSRGAIRFVFVEAGLNGQQGQTPFCKIFERLAPHGFVFSGFYDPMRGGENREILWFCNALFTHRDALRVPPV
jgi:FkbM family methyltransferase